MRISTNTIYQTAIGKISELQAGQSRLQQQIATGKHILTPSDDSIAASRALEITKSASMNAQYASNRQIANTHLTGLDNSLATITELLVSSRTPPCWQRRHHKHRSTRCAFNQFKSHINP
jgi:flagellar hook-associated protein 3 FlgL